MSNKKNNQKQESDHLCGTTRWSQDFDRFFETGGGVLHLQSVEGGLRGVRGRREKEKQRQRQPRRTILGIDPKAKQGTERLATFLCLTA
jgi:hypothetical protein